MARWLTCHRLLLVWTATRSARCHTAPHADTAGPIAGERCLLDLAGLSHLSMTAVRSASLSPCIPLQASLPAASCVAHALLLMRRATPPQYHAGGTDAGAHELDAATFTCRVCEHEHPHGDAETFNTQDYFPHVPTELVGDPRHKVSVVLSRPFAASVHRLQNTAVRTSTTGVIAAADAAARARGGRKRIRAHDFYAAMREFGYFHGTIGKWVEEAINVCPCCAHTGCRLGTDGNRKMVCYNGACRNCGKCWPCRNPDGYHAIGAATKQQLWISDAEVTRQLERMYPGLHSGARQKLSEP